ncbi:hypothetical protein L7F22_069159 [Adiantum nelumboides]|nr:hypothetical protein [Adiantum nelumboides]
MFVGSCLDPRAIIETEKLTPSQLSNFPARMEVNQRRYPSTDVGYKRAECSNEFCTAQEGALLQVPAAWFGASWAQQEYGDGHGEVFFFGVLCKFNAKTQKFACQFEGDSKSYAANWDAICDYLVWSSMKLNVYFQINKVSHAGFVFEFGESSHAPVAAILNSTYEEFYNAMHMGGENDFYHLQEEGGHTSLGTPVVETTPLETAPIAKRRGRPPKPQNWGRPKGSSMHRNDDATRSSPDPFDATDDEHSNDEHASEGEGVEGADDEALEAEGSVLDDSPEGDNDFIDVVPPKWNSGDGLEQEPHGTFRPLPPFNGIKGPDLGHLPCEFCDFHLFFMLFPLDLIDHIVSETNMYAEKERVRCGSLHDSMHRWFPIDHHSFLRFMGIALGMALHYMPSKRHYWKDEMVGSLVFPNFGEKMSQITFQQKKVAGLVNSLESKGHHVFFDKFFTSVKLLEHLLSEGQGGTEDRQAYTIDNMFETSNDVFSDAVIDKIAREHKREDEARWREANLQRQREADLEAERLENERLEREAEEREIQERLRREEEEEERKILEHLRREEEEEERKILEHLRRQEEEEAQKKEEPTVHYKRPRRRKYLDPYFMDEL